MGLIPSQLDLLDQILNPGMRVLTIGRLTVYARYLPHHRADPAAPFFDEFARRHYPDVTVDHLDGSDYQGAAIIQDMNLPLTAANRAREKSYDLILDGGSLEHFFDVPQALRNYDAMLRGGGLIYITTAANNHYGHGFYQFSAEFFHRVFSAGNGYTVEECFLEEHPLLSAEISPARRFFAAGDPKALGGRGQFLSSRPVLIHCLARKTGGSGVARSLIQSDYQAVWDGTPKPVATGARSALKGVFDRFPVFWRLYDRWKLGWSRRLGRSSDFPARKR
jgi:hypothetical protein